MGAALSGRESEALPAVRWMSPCPVTPAEVARLLNLAQPCEWCPVEKVPGQLAARVPDKSRWRVARVLKSLERKGLVERLAFRISGRLFGGYHLPGLYRREHTA